MKVWSTLLVYAGFIWGCASVSESPVPVMGVGEKQKEVESEIIAVESAVGAASDSVNALSQTLLFRGFEALGMFSTRAAVLLASTTCSRSSFFRIAARKRCYDMRKDRELVFVGIN